MERWRCFPSWQTAEVELSYWKAFTQNPQLCFANCNPHEVRELNVLWGDEDMRSVLRNEDAVTLLPSEDSPSRDTWRQCGGYDSGFSVGFDLISSVSLCSPPLLTGPSFSLHPVSFHSRPPPLSVSAESLAVLHSNYVWQSLELIRCDVHPN